MLLKSSWSFFNQKEGTQKAYFFRLAEHTKEKITTLIFSLFEALSPILTSKAKEVCEAFSILCF